MKIVHTGLNTFDANQIYSIQTRPAANITADESKQNAPSVIQKVFSKIGIPIPTFLVDNAPGKADSEAVAVKIVLGDDHNNFVMVHMKDLKAAATLQVSLALIMLNDEFEGKRILINVDTGMFTVEEDA